jgi:hypothetical protein
LFPVATTKAEAQADADAIRTGGSTNYIVAGEKVPASALTGSSDNYSLSAPLKSAGSDFTSDWSGEGSYHIWFALYNGSWTFYRTTNPVELTSAGSITRNAQTDFTKQTENGGGSPKRFTLTGITSTYQTEGAAYVLFGLFPPGTPDNTIIADAAVGYTGSGSPAAVVAYAGGSPSNLIASGFLTGSTTMTLTGTLTDVETGGEWAGSGTFDAWFALRGANGAWQGYKLANLNVQGNVSKATPDFTKTITNYTP